MTRGETKSALIVLKSTYFGRRDSQRLPGSKMPPSSRHCRPGGVGSPRVPVIGLQLPSPAQHAPVSAPVSPATGSDPGTNPQAYMPGGATASGRRSIAPGAVQSRVAGGTPDRNDRFD